MSLWNTDAPDDKKSNYGKVLHFDPTPSPGGHAMLVKCEKFLDGYCITTQTLNIALCMRDRITDRLTDRQVDKQTDRQSNFYR